MSDHTPLSRHFPWKATVPEARLLTLLAFLVTSEKRAANGSSFAVTPGEDGYRILWMDNTSERRIRQAALSNGLAVLPSTGQ